jgi:hypothetical protein
MILEVSRRRKFAFNFKRLTNFFALLHVMSALLLHSSARGDIIAALDKWGRGADDAQLHSALRETG